MRVAGTEKPTTLAYRLRTDQGLTQREVAAGCTLTANDVCRFERGHTALSCGKLLALAHFYGVSPDALLSNDFQAVPTINGFRYWRNKRHMSRPELAQAAGCTVAFLATQERRANPAASSALVAAVARALGVTMEELFQTYPKEALEAGDHHGNRTRSGGRPLNVVGRYRLAHNLTYVELADLLGQGSPQAARNLCISPQPSWRTLEKLAALEGIGVEEFLRRYGEEENENSTEVL